MVLQEWFTVDRRIFRLVAAPSLCKEQQTSRQKATMAAAAAAAAATIPEELSSLWKSLDPAIRAALIESETNAAAATSSSSSSSNNKAGLQGRRAKASSGPRIDASDATTTTLIGGSSFTKRESNPGWIKIRSDVYDAVKARRDAELSGKVPVDIDVTLPDGKILVEDKVR